MPGFPYSQLASLGSTSSYNSLPAAFGASIAFPRPNPVASPNPGSAPLFLATAIPEMVPEPVLKPLLSVFESVTPPSSVDDCCSSWCWFRAVLIRETMLCFLFSSDIAAVDFVRAVRSVVRATSADSCVSRLGEGSVAESAGCLDTRLGCAFESNGSLDRRADMSRRRSWSFSERVLELIGSDGLVIWQGGMLSK